MARYIDADEALKIIDNYTKTITDDGKVVAKAIRDVVEIICPEADVVEVEHGKWVNPTGELAVFANEYVLCSECNVMLPVIKELCQYWFCPNCGAKMDWRKM